MKRKKILGAGFLLLCLLRASSWIIPPSTDSFPVAEQLAVLYGIAGIGALLLTGRGLSTRLSPAIWSRLSLVSVGLFGLPVVLIGWARGSVTETGISAFFAAVPAVVAMVVANESEGVGLKLLTPALVAFGGALLILPVDLPGSLRGYLQLSALILAILLVGIASVRMFRLVRQVAYLDAMIVIGLSNMIFLMLCCIANGSLVWRWNQLASISSIASLVDLIEMALLVCLLRTISPIRLSARYLVIPLFTVIEGYIALEPQPTPRLLAGTALLTAGAAGILFAPIEQKEPALSLH